MIIPIILLNPVKLDLKKLVIFSLASAVCGRPDDLFGLVKRRMGCCMQVTGGQGIADLAIYLRAPDPRPGFGAGQGLLKAGLGLGVLSIQRKQFAQFLQQFCQFIGGDPLGQTVSGRFSQRDGALQAVDGIGRGEKPGRGEGCQTVMVDGRLGYAG